MLTRDVSNRARQMLYDAGFVQRREWMLYKIRPDHYPFNVSVNFEIDEFDPLLVQSVMDLMIERHEILRTTLRVVDGSLKQVVHAPDHFRFHFAYYDLMKFPEDGKKDWFEKKKLFLTHTPFNFEFGPLFRMAVFALTPSFFYIYFVFHHIISDERSLLIFRKEIEQIFAELSQGVQIVLPENIQYREYSSFENKLLDTDKGDEYRKFWKEAISYGLPRLWIIDKDKWDAHNLKYHNKVAEVKERLSRLPGCDRRFFSSVVRRYEMEEAGMLRFIYPQDMVGHIREYEKNGRNSLLSLFVGGIIMALYKMSAQTAFAFEIPASSRANNHFRETMGWLTTGAPCHFDISDALSNAAVLDYIDERLYLLSKYCVYPPDAVGCDIDPPFGSRIPVFFTLSHSQENICPDRTGILFHQHEGSGTYQDIAFFFTSYSDAISMDINYNNFLFSPDQIELMISTHLLFLEDIFNKGGIW